MYTLKTIGYIIMRRVLEKFCFNESDSRITGELQKPFFILKKNYYDNDNVDDG